MALNNDTIDMINYAKDIEIEYNIKLSLFIFFICLSIFLVWYKNKININSRISQTVYYLITSYAIMTLAFVPMYIFVLLRSVSIDLILKYVFIAYSIAFSMFIIFMLWTATEWFFIKYFNIRFFNNKNKEYRNELEYRRT
jgi:hypothetical protein